MLFTYIYILLHRIHAIHAFGKIRWNPENPQCLAPQFGRRWNTWFSSESPEVSLKSPCSSSNQNGQNWNINTIIHRCMILGLIRTWPEILAPFNINIIHSSFHHAPKISKNMTHIIFNHLKSSSNLVFFPQFTQFLRFFQPRPGPSRHRCSLHCSVITAMSGVISATAEAMPSMREAEPSWA